MLNKVDNNEWLAIPFKNNRLNMTKELSIELIENK